MVSLRQTVLDETQDRFALKNHCPLQRIYCGTTGTIPLNVKINNQPVIMIKASN